MRFENLTFDSIKAGSTNAILYLRNDGKNEIINCIFENNDGEKNIWCGSPETVIENCEFKDITYTTSGQIIYISGKGKHDLTNVTFSKITNAGNGVVSIIQSYNRPQDIKMDNITITWVDGKFYGINIGDNGNGDEHPKLTITNSLFEKNEIEKTVNNNQGGALIIIADKASLNITNSTIKDNYFARGIFAGTSNNTQIDANYNRIYDNEGDVILSTTAKQVTEYNVDYNYWGSENPELGDLNVNVIATNEELTNFETLKKTVDPTLNIKLLKDEIYEGDNVTIEIILNENATGNITISGVGEIAPQELKDGKTTFTIPNLLANQYTLTVSYSGDENYNSIISDDITVTVKEVVKEEKIDIADDLKDIQISITEGSNNTLIKITLPKNATGNITVYIDGKPFIKELDNGVANITKNLTVGIHNISVSYSGNDIYNGFETKNQTVTILSTETTNYTTVPSPASVEYTIGDSSNVTVTVLFNETYANQLSNIPVFVNVNGGQKIEINGIKANNTSFTFDLKGIADYLNAGENTISFEIDQSILGNSVNYNFNNLTVNAKSAPVKPDLITPEENALNIDVPAGTDSPTFSINIPNATGNLTVNVDGKNYTAPLVNGSATVTVPNLGYGNHAVTVIYSGDGKFAPIIKNTTVNVPEPVISNNKDVTMLYSSGTAYKIRVTQGGKAVAGQYVTFNFNGVNKKVKTNKNGYATFKIPTVKPKKAKYTIKVTYNGISKTNKVKVNSIVKAKNFKAKKSAKVTKVKVTLKKVNGKFLKGKTLKLKIKGKTVKAKTNKKGVATFKVKKNVLKKLKAGKKYKFTVTYGKDVVTKKVTIKK